MSVCAVSGCTEHYACRLRAKGVQVSPSATPSRVNNRHQPLRPMVDPAWERGVVGETRRDGSFMPVLAPGTTRSMGVHERQGQRSKVEEGIRRLKSDPNVFAQKAG
jgi:hypothetical protein